MKTVYAKLLPYQDHIGNCQLNYFIRNDRGERAFYCLQDNGERWGGIRLLRCTQDLEPSHEVRFSSVNVVWERPEINHDEPDSYEKRLKILVNGWIDNQERRNEVTEEDLR